MATTKIVRDWDAVNAYFDYGLDNQNRRVFMLGDFSEEIVQNVVKAFYFLAGNSAEPIEFYVSSFGGSQYEMFGLYDVMQSIPNPVQTIAVGKCMSAGPLLVAAGTRGERYSMPNTQWMVHMGMDFIGDVRPDAVRGLARHNEVLSQRWYELMAKHTGTSVAKWRSICKRVGDTYFGADVALEYGIIDHIWASEK